MESAPHPNDLVSNSGAEFNSFNTHSGFWRDSEGTLNLVGQGYEVERAQKYRII